MKIQVQHIKYKKSDDSWIQLKQLPGIYHSCYVYILKYGTIA